MSSLTGRRRLRNSVKEALDNLPSGICFFNARGILVLCNRQMYRLGFLLMGHDLQTLSELQAALGTADGAAAIRVIRHLKDDSWWKFSVREVTGRAGKKYQEVTAFDVTDLHRKQELLQEANEAKRQTVETLEHIQDNIIAIAREEEILEMKMELHNDLGYYLQTIRRFFNQGCPDEAKADFLAGQRNMLKRLRGELEGNDEIDAFHDLMRLAKTLGMQIVTRGELPEQDDIRELVAEALRECLTNATRHADGDKVFLDMVYGDGTVTVCITNNGKPPAETVRERGGLASLRKRMEGVGGVMTIHSRPEFRLEIALPVRRRSGSGDLGNLI